MRIYRDVTDTRKESGALSTPASNDFYKTIFAGHSYCNMPSSLTHMSVSAPSRGPLHEEASLERQKMAAVEPSPVTAVTGHSKSVGVLHFNGL